MAGGYRFFLRRFSLLFLPAGTQGFSVMNAGPGQLGPARPQTPRQRFPPLHPDSANSPAADKRRFPPVSTRGTCYGKMPRGRRKKKTGREEEKVDLTGQGLCGRIKMKTGKGRSPGDDEETQLIIGRIGSLPSGRCICAAVKKLCQAPSPGYAGLLPCAYPAPAAFGHGSFTAGRS